VRKAVDAKKALAEAKEERALARQNGYVIISVACRSVEEIPRIYDLVFNQHGTIELNIFVVMLMAYCA
jgi:regulator of PEP synthase PpsR (kinase-PPPase family)